MTRASVTTRSVVAAATLAAGFVACSELFEDAQQCAFDRDCEAIARGTRCDAARKICVAAGDSRTDAGLADGEAPLPDGAPGADDAAALPPSCDISPKPTADVPGTITNTAQGPQIDLTGPLVLDCSKDWILRARIVVKAGGVLTVQAGTTVRGAQGADAGVVVQPGGRLVAKGTATAPVVFTSDAPNRAAGDWRGIFLLGAAPPAGGGLDGSDPALASYGGNAADDTSGALEFVRIEYGSSGLVMAGVGNKTSLDGIQVRRTEDNCFQFYGGTAQAKHLVCQYPADEMFEVNAGFSGKLQFLFGQKTPQGANHHGLLVDDAFPVVYNATLCGDNVANAGTGVLFRNNARLDLGNAIVAGWFTGADAVGTIGMPVDVRSSVFDGNATNPAYAEDPAQMDQASPLFNDDNGYDELAMLGDPARANKATSAGLVDCYDPAAPKPWPNAALGGARTPPADGFFDTTATYVGAVKDGSDPWLRAKWISWQ